MLGPAAMGFAVAVIPESVGGFTALSVATVAATSIVTGAVGLIQNAANGEHISAWQAVKAMLVEPIVESAFAALGGFVSGKILIAGGKMLLIALASGGVTMVTTMAGSIASAALDGSVTDKHAWTQIGVQMAIAAAESIAFFFMGSRSFRKMVRSRLKMERFVMASEVPPEFARVHFMEPFPSRFRSLREERLYRAYYVRQANAALDNQVRLIVHDIDRLRPIDERLIYQYYRLNPDPEDLERKALFYNDTGPVAFQQYMVEQLGGWENVGDVRDVRVSTNWTYS
jgi:hypothetical protein